MHLKSGYWLFPVAMSLRISLFAILTLVCLQRAHGTTTTTTASTTPAPPSPTCPHRWRAPPGSQSCYRLWPESSKSWNNARKTCSLYDADLLKIDSKEEKEWIIQEIIKYKVENEWWIGLKRDQGNDQTWLWLDGSVRDDATSYLPWGSNEPNNFMGQEDCGEIWDNLLNDKDCTKPLQFICERPTNVPFLCDVDEGWDNHGLESCYKYYDVKLTLKDARRKCFEDDAGLLKISGEADQEILTDFIRHENKSSSWLKLSLLQVAGTEKSNSADQYHWSWDIDSSIEGKQTGIWWNGSPPDKDIALYNNTMCSVMVTNVTGYNNWLPTSCDTRSEFMCMKSLGKCPTDFRKNGGTCYRVHLDESMRWNDARGYCNLRGTKLVEINSEAIQDFETSSLLSSTDDSVDVWIGLSGSPGDWRWDSEAALGVYEQIQLAAMNTSGCVYIKSNGDGQWYTGDCSSNKVVLCMVPEDHPVITVTTQSKPKFICSEGYIGPVGENCYKIVYDTLDWLSARNACRAEGGDLAVIPTSEARDLILEKISADVWIGLNDRTKEGRHVWLDEDEAARDASWKAYTQTVNVVIGGKYSENCVVMKHMVGHEQHGLWIDIPCNFHRSFVCGVKGEWNVALGKVAQMSSTTSKAARLVDGCTAEENNCCTLAEYQVNPFVRVDLGTPYAIRKLKVYLSVLKCINCNTGKLYITNSSSTNPLASDFVYDWNSRSRLETIILPNITSGRYILIQYPGKHYDFSVCEIQVFEATGEYLAKEEDKQVPAENETNCDPGWTENAGSGTCYYQSKSPLTWVEAAGVCRSMNGHLAVPAEDSDLAFLAGLFTSKMSGSYMAEVWIGASANAGLEDWEGSLEVPYFREKLDSELSRKHDSSQTACALLYVDNNVQDGKPKSSGCLERRQFVCQYFSPYLKFTSVDSTSERNIQKLSSRVLLKDSSVLFQVRGIDGARLRLNGGPNYNIIVMLCMIKNKKSMIYENSDQKRTAWIKDLCSSEEYKPFYVSWKDENIVVGTGHIVGDNVFMSWSGHSLQDPVTLFVSSVITAEVFWKFQRDFESPSSEPIVFEDVNLALGKPTSQSGDYSSASTSNKAVDGCTTGTFASSCCTHTNSKFEPWWQVDLGQNYPIKEIIINRRTECCGQRLQGFTLTLSGSTKAGTPYENEVYTQGNYPPPAALEIPVQARGRYVKIQIPGRKEFLELCEVKVIQDMDVKWCEEGWQLLESGDNSACVHISDMKLSWQNAQDYCRDHGASLARPRSPEEQLFLFDLAMGKAFTAGGTSIWIGLHDSAQEGHFETVDGTPLGYRDWGKGEPNNLNVENCVSLRLGYTSQDGQLNDSPCNSEMRFFCRENVLTTSTSTTPTTTTTAAATTTTTTAPPTTTTVPPTTTTILTTSADPTGGVCEKGWTLNQPNQACYKLFFDSNFNFFDAMKNCLRIHSRLTNIESLAEQDFLTDMFKKDPTIDQGANSWGHLLIAGYEELAETEWRWYLYDGDWFPGVKWSQGQPDNYQSNEDCAGLRGYKGNIGEVNDIPCTWRGASGYICKRTSQEIICPKDWLYDVRTTTCYLEWTTSMTWQEASKVCDDRGGSLASIGSSQDQQFLNAIAMSSSQAYWLGASYTVGDKFLTWTDQTPWWRGTEFASGAGTSLGSKDLCGVLSQRKLTLEECGNSHPLICKLKVKSTTVASKTSTSIAQSTTPMLATSPRAAVASSMVPSPAVSASVTTSGVAASTDAVDELCGKGWDRNPDTNTCYQFASERVSWDEASSICQERAGNLVSISTPAEQQYLIGRLQGAAVVSKDLWIGANNHDLDSGWRWTDGAPFSYFNWQPLQPNDFYRLDTDTPARGCGAMMASQSRYFGKWDDPPCEDNKGYICKKVVDQKQVTVVTPVVPTQDQYFGCPGQGWVSYGDSCFLVVQEKKSWSEARDYCRQEKGDLASIGDQNEQNFIFSQLPQDSYCFNIWSNNTQCTAWAERGECDNNPTWMARHCHLACKLCHHNCRDKYFSSSKCTVWALSGECDKNHPWMLKNCAQSCGVCEGAPTRGYWMGLQRKPYSRVYQWIDHSQVTYTNWNALEPSGFRKKGQSCGAMFLQTGKWNDGECESSLPGFVCEQPKQLLDKTTESPFKDGCSGSDSYGYGSYCYTYVKDAKTWTVAKEYCTRIGGSLATIKDVYVQSFVASELANLLQDYWIGLSITNKTVTWTNTAKVTFTHFDKGFEGLAHSLILSDSCFAMRSYKPVGLWRAYNCATSLPFICQNLREGVTMTITTTTLSTTTLAPCEAPWVEFEGYCYWLSNEGDKKPWVEAAEHCSHYGATVASVLSSAENQFIISQKPDSEPYMIGLTDRAVEGEFTWSDGSPFMYAEWGIGEPNDHMDSEDCSEIRWDGLWNDISCYSMKRFVCKIPKGKPVENFGKTPKPVFEDCDGDPQWKLLGDNCYFLETVAYKNWFEANEDCQAKSASLASLHTETDQNSLTSLVSLADRVVWIGYNRLGRTGQYHWSDGSLVNYNRWERSQPNDNEAGEKCAIMSHIDGYWHDYNCNDPKAYLCMKPKDGSVVPAATTPTPTIEGGCPDGFVGFGNRCFLIVPRPEMTWDMAKHECETMQSELVSIHSSLEQAFLATQLLDLQGGLWIGLNDQREQGRFDWVDNSRMVYTNWDEEEPSSSYYLLFIMEECVEMYPGPHKAGLWNDLDCYSDRGFICATEKDPSLPQTADEPANEGCISGYSRFGGSCYRLNSQPASWVDSSTVCMKEGATLVTIMSRIEQAVVELLAGEDHREVWTGGRYHTAGEILWPNGEVTFLMLSDTFTKGSCVSSSGQIWNSKDCNELLPGICQMPVAGLTPTSTSAITDVTPPMVCREPKFFMYKGSCYWLVAGPASFNDAQDVCRSQGMMLTSVHSKEEVNHLVTLLQEVASYHVSWWIGMTGLTLSNGYRMWLWVDESQADYMNTFVQPDETHEHESTYGMVCVSMDWNGEWVKQNCSRLLPFVCKGPADPAPASVTPTAAPTEGKPTIPTGTGSALTTSVSSGTSKTYVVDPAQHNHRIVPIHGAVSQSAFDAEADSLTGGQIAGIVIGTIVGLFLIGVLIYTVYTMNIKKTFYGIDKSSLGFDNALFHKNDESVSLDG